MAVAAERISLRATGRSRRRLRLNRVMEGVAVLAASVALAALGIVVVSVVVRAWPALHVSLFTQTPNLFGGPGGGISSAIVGSALIVAMATGMALPVGVLAAIFMTAAIQLFLDVLNGVPTIVTGIFVYGLLVIGHLQSAYAGAFALAVVMLPLVARATQEVLLLVPNTLREASLALGVSRWRTVVGVIIPTTLGGILTGTVIAMARAAGETAPLLFTCSIFAPAVSTDVTHALPNIPVLIFTYSEQPDPALHQQAWAAALVLMAFILITSLTARGLLARSRRKLTHG